MLSRTSVLLQEDLNQHQREAPTAVACAGLAVFPAAMDVVDLGLSSAPGSAASKAGASSARVAWVPSRDLMSKMIIAPTT
ncbi:MAG: hypothetical protein CBB79_09840 [Synechococcus sp. TMED19]|nr:MAG: hypothetical protein CBB79_09840 [Synechococcus sp. TMED19]